MPFSDWKDEIETAVVAILCVFGGMIGSRMKYRAQEDETQFDRRRLLNGLYLAAGAGLTTAMLGQGLHVNRAFLIGSSIVAGYAGGRRFFEWIEKLLSLLTAIKEKRMVTLENQSRRFTKVTTVEVVPLQILAGAQDGRWFLMSLHLRGNQINAYRLDYLKSVKLGDPFEKYDTIARTYEKLSKHSWSVSYAWSKKRLEHVAFVLQVLPGEEYIVQRLEREKRCGTVEQVDETHWRFTAELFNSQEILPWIRTFIGRITQMNFSNRTVENKFKEDLNALYRRYGIRAEDDPEESEAES